MTLARNTAFVLLLLASSPLLAGDLEGSMAVRGSIVRVEVARDDKPAVGVRVFMVNDKQEIVAAGKINTDGEWTQSAPGPGSFEVIVVEDEAGEKALVMPFTVKGIETEPNVPPNCANCPARASEETPCCSPWLLGSMGLAGVTLAGLAVLRLVGRRE